MENPEKQKKDSKKIALQFSVMSAFQNYLKQFANDAQKSYQKVCRMFDLKPWDKEELTRRIKSLGYSINPLLATEKVSSIVTDIIGILDKGNHYVDADMLQEFVLKQADDIDRLRMISALLEDEDPEQMYDYLMRHGVVVKEHNPVSARKTAVVREEGRYEVLWRTVEDYVGTINFDDLSKALDFAGEKVNEDVQGVYINDTETGEDLYGNLKDYDEQDIWRLGSKKTAQEPKKPEEEIEEKPEEVIKEELPEAPLEDELTPSIELEPEPISEPSILETMTPMDYNLLTTLNKQRETAINKGDTEEMMNVDKQIADIIDKYTMPITPEEMTPEAFIGRRLQTQLGIRRDMIPLLAKASEAIRKLPNIFNVTLGQIGLLKVETSEWQETPETGNIEFVVRIKPVASRVPYRAGIVKINVFEDKAEMLPFIWDIAGRKYNLDSDGLKLFLKVDTFKELDEFEKKYLEEERTIQKGLRDGEIKPNVQGLGRVPIIPSGHGISKPKTTWSSRDLLKKTAQENINVRLEKMQEEWRKHRKETGDVSDEYHKFLLDKYDVTEEQYQRYHKASKKQ